MLLHFLKIAFRNMWKYRRQTLISVIGLAVGFTCFALATLWIVYEMTFDTFHKNAKNLYVVSVPSLSKTDHTNTTPFPLAAYLHETFPEIANAASLVHGTNTVDFEGVAIQASFIISDSSFVRIFDVKVLEGSWEFLIPDSKKLAITQEKARQLFGDEHPIGKKVGEYGEICAVVSGMSLHSNYFFDFIGSFPDLSVFRNNPWTLIISDNNTVIELIPGTHIEAFEKKLYAHETGAERRNISKMTIKPITKLRYTDPEREMVKEVKFKHILIFAVSGMLVILCSLFNYLTLFISRFRIRQKELALRVVCGASGGSLLVMLSVEFILTLLFSILFGFLLTYYFHYPFLILSDITMSLPTIYRESLLYIGGVIIVSLFMFWLVLFIFRQRSLNLSIRRSNKKLFRKMSVVVQLVISMGFAFCTIIIVKQMYFLHHSGELGFSFKNRGSIKVYDENNEIVADRLRQIPEIMEVVDARTMKPLPSQDKRNKKEFETWDEQQSNAEKISLDQVFVSPEYTSFYDFRLVVGEMLSETDPETMVLLNEAAVKAFGWHDPVGKHFGGKYTVKGVIKNVCDFAPTLSVYPIYYLNLPSDQQTMAIARMDAKSVNAAPPIYYGRYILFKYREGLWESCEVKLEGMKSDYYSFDIYNTEIEYNSYLKSEQNLLKLLSVVSVICVLICVFGFVSLVSLTCEERRKAIAIRKINGATVGDILSIFAKEYVLLLIIGAVIAFSTGFFIMQRWIEQYVKQTSIPAWIYLSILFVMAMVIVLCVGWQVYKTSIEDPAEVVKVDN